MGACLSKSGSKKNKDDRAPYQKAGEGQDKDFGEIPSPDKRGNTYDVPPPRDKPLKIEAPFDDKSGTLSKHYASPMDPPRAINLYDTPNPNASKVDEKKEHENPYDLVSVKRSDDKPAPMLQPAMAKVVETTTKTTTKITSEATIGDIELKINEDLKSKGTLPTGSNILTKSSPPKDTWLKSQSMPAKPEFSKTFAEQTTKNLDTILGSAVDDVSDAMDTDIPLSVSQLKSNIKENQVNAEKVVVKTTIETQKKVEKSVDDVKKDGNGMAILGTLKYLQSPNGNDTEEDSIIKKIETVTSTTTTSNEDGKLITKIEKKVDEIIGDNAMLQKAKAKGGEVLENNKDVIEKKMDEASIKVTEQVGNVREKVDDKLQDLAAKGKPFLGDHMETVQTKITETTIVVEKKAGIGIQDVTTEIKKQTNITTTDGKNVTQEIIKEKTTDGKLENIEKLIITNGNENTKENGERKASLDGSECSTPTSPTSSTGPSPRKHSRIPGPVPIEPEIIVDLAETPSGDEEEEEEEQNVNGSYLYQDSEDECQEPVPIVMLKTAVKKILYDFGEENDRIKAQHHLTSNTRGRLMNAIDKWFVGGDKEQESQDAPRVMVICGVPGIGKSCVAAEVTRKYAHQLAGCHFFQYNSSKLDHNTASSVVISLAHYLCDVFPNYINMLPRLEKLECVLSQGDVGELFDCFIQQPLNSEGLAHNPDEHKLIVIDALDECDFEDRETLSQIVKSFNEVTPEWLYLLVTSTNDNELLGELGHTKQIELKQNTNENMKDVKRFLNEPMSRFMDRISLDGGVTQLVKKTDGSFLVAKFLKGQLDRLPDRSIAMREVDGMFPKGAAEIYQEGFRKFLDQMRGIKFRKMDLYNVILGVLIAAREPLHINFLVTLFNANVKDKVTNALEEMGEFITIDEENKLSFTHSAVIEWLTNEENADLSVLQTPGREQLAEMCLKWLGNIINEDGSTAVTPALQEYALKHAVYHFTDVSKQQENVANLLCSLKYIEEKLKISGVTIGNVIDDYTHQHHQSYKGTPRQIYIDDYMKRFPKSLENIISFRKFLIEMEYDIKASPEFILQVAANYTKMERLKQNARVELADKPWLEDLTAAQETQCIVKRPNGTIKGVDISPDGKTVAVICKDDEYNVKIHLYNTRTGERNAPPLDVKNLKDRQGLCAKFMADGSNIFVGSFSTYVSDQGKQVPSHLDMLSINMAEKFSIECCDVSQRHLVCGLSTFPWGGRSLHICAFDLKSKKCVKTLEVLRFRFGGSSQFGIRSLALSKNKPFMCACVKQDTKSQLRVIVYNTTKFAVTNSIDVFNDSYTRCIIADEEALVVGSGIRSPPGGKSKDDVLPVQPEYWQFKDVSNKSSSVWTPNDHHAVFDILGDGAVCAKWTKGSSNAIVNIWNTPTLWEKPSASFVVRGLTEVTEMCAGGSMIVFTQGDELKIFSLDDLEPATDADIPQGLSDILVDNIGFIPRSNTMLIATESHDQELVYSIKECELTPEECLPTATNLTDLESVLFDPIRRRNYFKGSDTHSLCLAGADGTTQGFSSGDRLIVWDKSRNTSINLPKFLDLQEPVKIKRNKLPLMAVASEKENIVAVVYMDAPADIFLFDIKSGNKIRKFSREVSNKKINLSVTDMAFIPSNGFLLSYHREADNTLCSWSPKVGELLSIDNVKMSYSRISRASDRFALSVRTAKREGKIILRNGDAKISATLNIPEGTVWVPGPDDGDIEFSPDGTIVACVCTESNICRVWNAANGEVLNDLTVTFNASAEIVGMLSNTHIVFHDDRLVVVDIASSSILTVVGLNDNFTRKARREIHISPKNNVIAGIREDKKLSVFYCHNFATVKRKTTLQRMKSFSK